MDQKMTDTVKNQLKNIILAEKTVNALLEERDRVSDRLRGVPSGLKERVKAGGDSRGVETGVARLIELERTIDMCVDLEVSLKQLYLKKIEALTDRRQRVLLIERYFNGKTWTEIAEILGCHVRTVYTLHGEALQALVKNNSGTS